MLSILRYMSIALFLSQVQALYFYIHGPTQKCFMEELPRDTLVVGTFKATQWNEQTRTFGDNPSMGVHITVDEIFDNDHRIVSQKSASTGKFTFSAVDAGSHRLCFTPTGVAASSGFLFGGSQVGGIRFELDMVIGATSQIDSSDKGKMGEVVQKVKDLNARLQDIRREQIFQREREAEFRDQSESVNSRVIRWTLIQLAVLAVTCAWQLSYLRAFFIKQKLT